MKRKIVHMFYCPKMKNIALLFMAIFYFGNSINAQTTTSNTTSTSTSPNPYILFSGLVLTADSLKAVPFVTIKSTRKGIIGYSEYNGHFSIVVKKGDTLLFTQVEHKPSYHIIPDTLSQDRYYVVKLIEQDTIDLPTIFIRAMPPRASFDKYFLTADIPDDALERARKNLEQEQLKEAIKNKPQDSKQSYSLLNKQRAESLYYTNQVPPMKIFSPLAWQEFLQAWKRGDFKKKSKKKTSTSDLEK